jgi:hypothetical protein
VSPKDSWGTGPSSGQDAITSGLGDGAAGARSVEQPASNRIDTAVIVDLMFTNLHLSSSLDSCLTDLYSRNCPCGGFLRLNADLRYEVVCTCLPSNLTVGADLRAVAEGGDQSQQDAGQDVWVTHSRLL